MRLTDAKIFKHGVDYGYSVSRETNMSFLLRLWLELDLKHIAQTARVPLVVIKLQNDPGEMSLC